VPDPEKTVRANAENKRVHQTSGKLKGHSPLSWGILTTKSKEKEKNVKHHKNTGDSDARGCPVTKIFPAQLRCRFLRGIGK